MLYVLFSHVNAMIFSLPFLTIVPDNIPTAPFLDNTPTINTTNTSITILITRCSSHSVQYSHGVHPPWQSNQLEKINQAQYVLDFKTEVRGGLWWQIFAVIILLYTHPHERTSSPRMNLIVLITSTPPPSLTCRTQMEERALCRWLVILLSCRTLLGS